MLPITIALKVLEWPDCVMNGKYAGSG